MSTFPWDILGIDPTSDEMTIHRAYARMLKKCRPDADPEGFALLVAARKVALDLRPTVDGGETPPEGSEPDAPSQRNPAPTGRSDAPAEGIALAAILNRLRGLLHEPHGRHPGPIWNSGLWRAALERMPELDLPQRLSLREFIVSKALPLLPPMQSVSAATTDARNNRSPGQVAAVWEEEFSIAQNQPELVQLCGASAMLNYLAWLDCHRRLTNALEGEVRARAHAAAVTEAIAQLRELLRGSNGTGPVWDAEKWQTILLPLAELPPQHRNALRDFIVREALPLLPNLSSIRSATSDMRERRGPCAVAALWESEFSIARDHALLNRTTGAPTMSRYIRWANLAALVSSPDQRSDVEHRFRDCLDQLLPPQRASAEASKKEAWDATRWDDLFGQLRQMGFADGVRCRDLLAERLTLWLPDRPRRRLRRGKNRRGPAAVVEKLEDEFTLSDSFDAPSDHADGLLRYQHWLACARNRRSVTANRERILLALALAIAMAAGYYATSLLK